MNKKTREILSRTYWIPPAEPVEPIINKRDVNPAKFQIYDIIKEYVYVQKIKENT